MDGTAGAQWHMRDARVPSTSRRARPGRSQNRFATHSIITNRHAPFYPQSTVRDRIGIATPLYVHPFVLHNTSRSLSVPG